MEKDKRKYWLIGLFTLVTLTVLVFFYQFLKGRNLFRSVSHYYVYFNGVEGLYKSNKVLMNGMRVGDVSGIWFAPDNSGRLIVELQLPSHRQIMRHATASIINTGLIGGRVIRLNNAYGPGPYLQDGDTLRGNVDASYAEMMDTDLQPIIKNADTLVRNLKNLTAWVNASLTDASRQSFAQILRDVEASAGKLRESLSTLPATAERMGQLVQSLTTTAQSATRTMRQAGTLVDSLTAMRLPSLAERLGLLVGNLNHLVLQLGDSTSTIGRLSREDGLYLQLERVTTHLDSLLVDVKAHPKRYVNFSLF